MRKESALSIGLHLAVFAFLHFAATNSPHFAPSKDPAKEADLNEALKTRSISEKEFAEIVRKHEKKQIVQKSDSIKTEKFKVNPTQAHYLSTQNQYVDTNTRAARVGDHKNVLKEGLQDISKLFELTPNESTSDAGPEAAAPAQESSEQLALKESPKGRTHQFSKSSSRSPASVGDGFSATDEYLPDVAIAANTLLNTREYKYASFYERIRQRLKHEWERQLRSEIEGMHRQGIPPFRGERITKLKVSMEKSGRITRVVKVGTAGYVGLDRAAVTAFERAGPFPNPPRELLQESGELEVDWSFVVLGSNDSGIRFNVQRHPAGI